MPTMIPISILDLSPILQGSGASQSFKNTVELARHSEKLGFHRFWLAEHHNVQSLAASATAVLIGHVAAATSTIRVGAGGIMLSNHAPLLIAEQFGTLEALFPHRIDLGVGRSPGTNSVTVKALRRNLSSNPAGFVQDVLELMSYFGTAQPGQAVCAVPGAGLKVPIWILGSSPDSARLAAALGVPFAFAAHVAPADMDQSIALYRAEFKPSNNLNKSHLMVALNVFAAETDAEAWVLASSLQQIFVNQRLGRAGPLPPPVENMQAFLDPQHKVLLDRLFSTAAIGSPATVSSRLDHITARTGADELIVTAQIFNRDARLRSLEIISEALNADQTLNWRSSVKDHLAYDKTFQAFS